jgi:hypothetical protein
VVDRERPPLHLVRDLHQRFDGPVPEQYTVTEQARLRRRRGLLAAYERQAAGFLDSAQRADNELVELASDDRTGLQEMIQRRTEDRDRNLAYAAEALKAAAAVREELNMPPPLMVTAATMSKTSP